MFCCCYSIGADTTQQGPSISTLVGFWKVSRILVLYKESFIQFESFVAYLRSAEIIYSMTWTHQNRLSAVPQSLEEWMTKMMGLLSEARHNLGLFQHHDGVTGTAKDHVVQDYAKRYFVVAFQRRKNGFYILKCSLTGCRKVFRPVNK